MGQYNPHGIRGICHYSIPCTDTERSLTFYEELFGAKIYEDEIGPYKFGFSEQDKALGRQEHIFVEIAGQRVELLGLDPGGKSPLGTHHAYRIGPNDVVPIQEHLRAHGIPFRGPETHRGTAAVSIYFQDPDGNALEFCCWDGYPKLSDVPMMYNQARPDITFEWDPEARKGRPRAEAKA